MDFGQHLVPCDHVIIKTKYSFAFTNIRPFLPLHVLVSPISKKERLYDLGSDETADLFNTVRMVTIALKNTCDGFTLTVQDGCSAGQTVPHVHVHVVPRVFKDLERNNDIYKSGALDSAERPSRKYDEMKEEALKLRPMVEAVFKSGNFHYEKI